MGTTDTGIRDRIRREARIAGLRDYQRPSLEAVERRRLQLWGVALLVLLILAVALVAASAVEIDTGSVSPTTVRYSLVGLAVGFCAYVVEKEIHLHRLSRLLFDERVLNSALSNRIQQLQSLAEASRAVNSVLDLGEVLDVILARALDMLEGAEGSIMLLEGEELRVVATRGSDLALGARVRLGESIAGRVARTREPLVLSGEADSRRFPGHQPRHRPVHSAMVVPLVNRGELLGVLNVNAAPGRDFDEYDLHLLSLFAEPVAAAITNARLFEAERQHVANLLELDRMKTQFVASVSHELRTPLTSIRGAVTASRRCGDQAQRDELLDVIERQAHRLSMMVEEMLTSARIERESKVPLLRRLDLAALVRLVALDSQVAGRPVTVRAPDRCEVRADPEALRRIVGNLIENAHKYGEAPIRVSLEQSGDQVVLSVVDSGPGVPASERQQIFERFFRAERTKNQPGLGLGLPIVRGLVDALGGRVWVEDAPGGGAAFRVALRARATEEEEVALVR